MMPAQNYIFQVQGILHIWKKTFESLTRTELSKHFQTSSDTATYKKLLHILVLQTMVIFLSLFLAYLAGLIIKSKASSMGNNGETIRNTSKSKGLVVFYIGLLCVTCICLIIFGAIYHQNLMPTQHREHEMQSKGRNVTQDTDLARLTLFCGFEVRHASSRTHSYLVQCEFGLPRISTKLELAIIGGNTVVCWLGALLLLVQMIYIMCLMFLKGRSCDDGYLLNDLKLVEIYTGISIPKETVDIPLKQNVTESDI